jgi:hypothetical protein
MNKATAIAILLLAALALPATAAHANVPTVMSITRRTDTSGNTLIDVKVNHADPTTSHYISQITLDLDGTTRTFTDLTKATTVEATYSLNIGNATPKLIKAQATCIIHGPSAWLTESTTTGTTGGTSSGGVDAYPLEAIAIGATLAVTVLLLSRRN